MDGRSCARIAHWEMEKRKTCDCTGWSTSDFEISSNAIIVEEGEYEKNLFEQFETNEESDPQALLAASWETGCKRKSTIGSSSP